MGKLNTKQDVIEWYWPDFLDYCLRQNKDRNVFTPPYLPSVDNFWLWYTTKGPLGLKRAGLFYTKTKVEYL